MAQVLIDRLVHHGEVYYLEGDNYRVKGKENLLNGEDSKEVKQNQSDVSPGKERRPESSKN